MRISDWSSDVCSSDLGIGPRVLVGPDLCAGVLQRVVAGGHALPQVRVSPARLHQVLQTRIALRHRRIAARRAVANLLKAGHLVVAEPDRKSTRLNSSH